MAPRAEQLGSQIGAMGSSLQSHLLLQLLCGSSGVPLAAPPEGVFSLSFLPSIRLGGPTFPSHPPSWETWACLVVSGSCCVWSMSLGPWRGLRWCPGPAITKYCRVGGLNSRGLFLQVLRLEVWDQGVSRAGSRWGLSLGLVDSHLLPVSSRGPPSICVCVLSSSFYGITSQIGLGPTVQSSV